jgi:hypothetical protein
MKHKITPRAFLGLLGCSVFATILLGCSGSSNGPTGAPQTDPQTGTTGPGSGATRTASATVRIEWPARAEANSSAAKPRLIPLASNSIKININYFDSQNRTVLLASKTINRPATTATFESLPAGGMLVDVTAYPGINAQGIAQATVANVPLLTQPGQSASVVATMLSTIKTIQVQPAAPSVAKGANITLTAIPRDATNRIVLVAPAKLRWSTGNSAIAAVTNLNGSGIYKGVQTGRTTVRVTDIESTRFGEAPLTVTNATPTPSPTPSPSPSPTPTATSGGYCPPGMLYDCNAGCPRDANGNFQCKSCSTGNCEVPLVY